MPVRYSQGGEHHDRDEYSFYTRDHGSRDFARSRRFGGEDAEEGRTMSLVSSPLQVPLVGRRSVSPSHRSSQAPQQQQFKFNNADDDEIEEEIKHMQERRRQSVENRRRLDLKTYDDYDFDEPLEPLVPTYQPRIGRSGLRSNDIRYGSPSPREPRRQQRPQMDDYNETYDDVDIETSRQHQQRSVRHQQYEDEPRRQPSRQQKQDEELQSILNWRKRSQEPLVHTDFGYAVPPMRKRGDPGMAEEDENIRSVAGYIAKRKQFAVEDDDEMQYYKNPNYQYRYRGIERPLVITDRDVEESLERGKLDKAPMFDMKLRSHVVWEKMNVKFTCTVRGSPTPRVTWYKDMVPLEPSLCSPGKFKISNQFGLHTLEICRASIEDSGTYRVSMQNRKGEISSYATLVVRRYDGGRIGVVDFKSGYNLKKPTDYPDVEGLNIPGYPRFVVPLYGKTVQEREAMIITCEVDGSPDPEVFWTLNGRTIEETSSHIQSSFDGKQATLTILKVHTDDEGEYCCRAFNSSGAATSRCYVRVQGSDAPPSAPSCVEISEATRDYVMLSWKGPGYVGHFGGAPIEGYIIETAEAGSSIWKPWNKTPVRLTKTPITGLGEGRVYFLRVRAVTRWGTSAASLPSAAVAIRDAGSPRLQQEFEDPSSLLPPETDEISVEEEDGNELPGIPTKITATLSPVGDVVNIGWAAPECGEECDVEGYLIECCESEGEEWKTVTSQPLQTTDPYPVTGLAPGKSYKFRVFSVNSVGCSEPSECSTVVEIATPSQESSPEPCVADIEDIKKPTEDCRDSCENAEQCSSRSQEEIGACDAMPNDDGKTDAKQQSDVENSTDIIKEKEGADTVVKPKSAVVRSKLPSAPVDVKGLTATREYITVGWTPPFKTAGEDPMYYIEMKMVGSEGWKICNQSPITLTHYPVSGVESDQSYVFRVRAVTSRGTSQFSEESEPIIATDGIKPPNWWGGVQGLIRVADEKGRPCVTKNSVKICWDPPTTDGGSSVTGYFLEYRPAGGKFRPVNNKPLNQRHFTVDGLNTGEEFEFRVRACNIAGSGDWKMLPGRVLVKDPEPPTYPSNLLITAMDVESVSLKWKAPQCKGDAEMIGYVVERCKEGSEIWIPCNKMPEEIRDEKYKVDGLVTGQTYFFRVSAVNKVGTGKPSLMSCFVTPGEDWELVVVRQNAMLEMRRKKQEEELAKKRALEEEERRQAFVSGIEENKVDSGTRAFFECIVKDPHTQVKWCLGNNKEVIVEPEGKYDIVHVGIKRSLAINNCQISDIQLVHCVALYNDCATSAYCIVDGMVPVVFVECPEDIYINRGETASFSCTLTRDDAKVTWSKNGVEISESDERYEIISDGNKRNLVLKNCAVNDVASYTVAGFGGSFTAHLVVDGVLPAQFTNSVHGGDYDHEEEEAEFDCVILPSALYKDGKEPECAWYHNGERVEEGDDKYEIIKDGNRRILKILNLNYEDSGEIICKCGGDETRCEIDVERPPPPPPKAPVLQAEDAAINFLQGLRSEALPGIIRLYCVVAKLRDDVKIFWYKDDVEIDTKEKQYSCVIDRELGLVSLVFNHPTPDYSHGTYTCEFITIHSTFDTKVNFNFGDGEYDHVYKAAMKLKEDEEREKQQRLDERKKKRAELRKKREEGEKKANENGTPVKTEPTPKQAVGVAMTSDGITYDVDQDAHLVLQAEVTGMDSGANITWMKNSVVIIGDRFDMTLTDNQVKLLIKDPTEDDAGTYTCKIKTKTSSTEMSADVTGKVFKELLAKSNKIRQISSIEEDGVQERVNDVIDEVTENFDDGGLALMKEEKNINDTTEIQIDEEVQTTEEIAIQQTPDDNPTEEPITEDDETDKKAEEETITEQ
ncbi:myomesin-1-like isoform X1 [Styela clava]